MSKKGVVEVPENFRCPISMRILNDPVVTADGHTYSHQSILQWWASSGRYTSPMTNEVLRDRTLRPNVQLRKVIEDFLEQNPQIDARTSGSLKKRVSPGRSSSSQLPCLLWATCWDGTGSQRSRTAGGQRRRRRPPPQTLPALCSRDSVRD